MTDVQWAALMRGDESYGGGHGFYAIAHAIRDTFEHGYSNSSHQQPPVMQIVSDDVGSRWWTLGGVEGDEGDAHTFANLGRRRLAAPNLFLVPQGRCAEGLVYSCVARALAEMGAPKPWVIPSNGFFDTTEAQAHVNGFHPLNLFSPKFAEPFDPAKVDTSNPFKGDIDLARLRDALDPKKTPGTVPFVLLTVTNNTAAGQAVSMANIAETARLAWERGVPVMVDAARFAENAWFIQRFEPGYARKSLPEIVREMFSYVDVFTMSAKKDGLGNMGGFLCFRNAGRFHTAFSRSGRDIGLLLQEQQVMRYGSATAGGMSGRDIMALAAGLYMVLRPEYLDARMLQTRKLAVDLVKAGVKGVVMPPGGHAVYIDMTEFFSSVPGVRIDDFAGVGFEIELIRLYGIRCCELGPFAFEWDQKTEEQRKGILNLVRFAIPRNMYSEDHMAYTVAAVAELQKHAAMIPKVTVARGAELHLRHFQSGLKPNYYNGKL
jgi:tryptophanase